MKPLLHVVSLESIPIWQQLQWEEALLRVDQRNWCLLNRGSAPAIVMGISGDPQQLICSHSFHLSPLPLIRRFSGGGTVVVDDSTLFITFICQSDALPFPSFPTPLMEWTATLYDPLFSPGTFALLEHDYTLNGRKWGGNAQSIVRGRWLHHSSLLWDYSPHRMSLLRLPPRMPTYRAGRPHADFLCRLQEHWPNPAEFQKALLHQVERWFECVEDTSRTLSAIASLPHRKATQWVSF